MHLNKNDNSTSPEEELAYRQTLRNISYLRSKGYEDTEPEMVKLRGKLRDLLESRKKNKGKDKGKALPNLLGYRTMTLANVEKKPESPRQSKYVLAGTVFGLASIAYYFYKKSTS